MAIMPGAQWRPLPNPSTTRMARYDLVIIHTMVGSLEGTDGYFRRLTNGVNSHFGTGGDGTIRQWVDSALRSGANAAGNHRSITIENADMGPQFPAWNTSDGNAVPAFTPEQVEANARICAWANQAHGVPLVAADTSRPSARGIGFHRLGINNWRVPDGELWSSATGKVCPAPRRIAQIPQIIARARQIVSGAQQPNPTPIAQEDDDMPRFDLIRNKDTGEMVLAAPGVWYHIPDANFVSLYVGRGLLKDGTPDIDVADHEFVHFRSIYLSAVIDTPIPRSAEAGGSSTSLRAQAHWEDHNFNRVASAAANINIDSVAERLQAALADKVGGATRDDVADALRQVLREGTGD